MKTGVSLMLLTCACAPALAQDPKSAKVTVTISGVVDEDSAAALRKTLGKVAGIKVKLDDVVPPEQPDKAKNYFSKPFVIELPDLAKTDLGAVAKAVAQTKLPAKVARGPWLNLALWHPNNMLTESEVVALREAVADAAGVDSRGVGGTGGVSQEGRFWIRLDGSGNARLADILTALRNAKLDLRLEKQ